MERSPQQVNQAKLIYCEQSLIFFAKLLHAKPKHASGYIITSWLTIALDEIKNLTDFKRKGKADCKQSTTL